MDTLYSSLNREMMIYKLTYVVVYPGSEENIFIARL